MLLCKRKVACVKYYFVSVELKAKSSTRILLCFTHTQKHVSWPHEYYCFTKGKGAYMKYSSLSLKVKWPA